MSDTQPNVRKDTPTAEPARPRRSLASLYPLRRLLPYLTRYPARLALTLFFLLISAISSLAIPATAGGLIDEGFVQQNLENVSRYSLVIIAIALIMAAAAGARFYFISVIGERVVADLRRSLFGHMLTLDVAYFDMHRVGELTSRLSDDIGNIRGAIGSSLSVMIRSFVIITGAVAMMFLTSPLLATGVVILGPLTIIPLIWLGRRLRGMSRRTQDAMAAMSSMATEALGAARTIKSFVQEPNQTRLYAERAEDSFNAEMTRVAFRAFLVGLIMFLAAGALVLFLWLGAQAVFLGQVTAGELAQFLIYAFMASNALTALSEIWGTLQSVAGATERLVEILDTEPTIGVLPNPVAMPSPPIGTVAFENVSFAYKTRDDNEAVLSDLSFEVRQGETVALVGASGAGKTTVFALVQRFYDVLSGSVRVDGVDVREVDPSELRQRFAYVEQEPTLFAGTVAENIRFGKPDASLEEIKAAARAALVEDYVVDLPHGYDTIVGERGVMLSGGQKQRLAIARALLKDAPILLLDEATSALDAQSERLVQVALERLMEGRTTLVIAHRLATIRDADRILVLEKGRLIDQGTHQQLVLRGGRYAELAKLQFRYEQPVAAAGE